MGRLLFLFIFLTIICINLDAASVNTKCHAKVRRQIDEDTTVLTACPRKRIMFATTYHVCFKVRLAPSSYCLNELNAHQSSGNDSTPLVCLWIQKTITARGEFYLVTPVSVEAIPEETCGECRPDESCNVWAFALPDGKTLITKVESCMQKDKVKSIEEKLNARDITTTKPANQNSDTCFCSCSN